MSSRPSGTDPLDEEVWPVRGIVDFGRDDAGDWYAVLTCGHTRHVRHDPPWQIRPWVLSEASRRARLGDRMACRRCWEDGEPASPA